MWSILSTFGDIKIVLTSTFKKYYFNKLTSLYFLSLIIFLIIERLTYRCPSHTVINKLLRHLSVALRHVINQGLRRILLRVIRRSSSVTKHSKRSRLRVSSSVTSDVRFSDNGFVRSMLFC